MTQKERYALRAKISANMKKLIFGMGIALDGGRKLTQLHADAELTDLDEVYELAKTMAAYNYDGLIAMSGFTCSQVSIEHDGLCPTIEMLGKREDGTAAWRVLFTFAQDVLDLFKPQEPVQSTQKSGSPAETVQGTLTDSEPDPESESSIL